MPLEVFVMQIQYNSGGSLKKKKFVSVLVHVKIGAGSFFFLSLFFKFYHC
jgi:hypothetical protein